jgi:hypothetical protein
MGIFVEHEGKGGQGQGQGKREEDTAVRCQVTDWKTGREKRKKGRNGLRTL